MRRWSTLAIVAAMGTVATLAHPDRPVAIESVQAPSAAAKPSADEPPVVGETSGRYLRVRLRRAATGAAPGDRVTLVAEIVPAPKMHVYAPGQREYLSVELTLPASPDYKAAPPVFPPSKALYLEPIKSTVQVFDAPFRITQVITLARTPAIQKRAAAADSIVVTGTLKYQACDDLVCYRPDTAALSWPVPLKRGK